jgi:hypothetical protein
MNGPKLLLLVWVTAFLFTGCQPAANTSDSPTNVNANSNANSNRAATSGAPTMAALVSLEKNAFEAWKNDDDNYWKTFVSDRFEAIQPHGKIHKADVIKYFESKECKVKSYTMSDEQMKQLGNDAALLTYKATADATCKGVKQPDSTLAATIFVREGDQWRAIYHAESVIQDPNNPSQPMPPPPAKPADKPATNASPAVVASPVAAASPNAATEALLALEKKGWDGWKNKDNKIFEEWASSYIVVAMFTKWADLATTEKMIAEQPCGAKSVTLTEPSAVSLGPEHTLLLYLATIDGKCQGQAIPPQYGATIFENQGGTWKAVFNMST